MEGEKKCPHYEALLPITTAIDEADVIILPSPVYVYHATGAMKAFLDHYGYRWMVHRPEESMFKKQGDYFSCEKNRQAVRERKAGDQNKSFLFRDASDAEEGI